MRLIDADALLEKAYIPNTNILNGWWHKETLEDVENAPTIEPKTGHWKITDAYPHNVYCSECYTRFAQTHWAVWKDGSLPRDYCPNCGARMEASDD